MREAGKPAPAIQEEEEKKDIEAALKVGTVASKVAAKPDEGPDKHEKHGRKEEK